MYRTMHTLTVQEDIFYTLELSIAQAALGDEIEVPTLEGKVKLTIPAGTQTGKRFRTKKKEFRTCTVTAAVMNM